MKSLITLMTAFVIVATLPIVTTANASLAPAADTPPQNEAASGIPGQSIEETRAEIARIPQGSLMPAMKTRTDWPYFESKMKINAEKDYRDGWAHIISGSLGFLGGILAQSSTSDPLEKGVFILSQSLGIAAIGHGATLWKNGNEDRLIYSSLRDLHNFNDEQKTAILRSYDNHRSLNKLNESYIKALTFGLISALNISNAAQTKDNSIKNALYFVGTINLFAAISFSFP